MRHALTLALAALLAASFATPSAAETDDGPELWLNPSVSWALDDDTAVELETAQRLRREADGRADTYYVRLWLNQDVSDAISVSAGVEQRSNEPGSDETRLLQQLSAKRGILRTRLRLEQRFVEDGRMGVRFRPRAGVEVPIGLSERWSAVANAELFLTLRSTAPGAPHPAWGQLSSQRSAVRLPGLPPAAGHPGRKAGRGGPRAPDRAGAVLLGWAASGHACPCGRVRPS
jgi:hypothetical protein